MPVVIKVSHLFLKMVIGMFPFKTELKLLIPQLFGVKYLWLNSCIHFVSYVVYSVISEGCQ